MARSLGVATTKAEIDEGTISGLSSLSTASGSLVGFFGATATAQSAFVTNTSGSLGNTNTQLTAVIAALVCRGLMAAS